MDLATVSPLQLGWALAGFGVIAWFVWRRRKLGPMTTGVTAGYAILLGCSGAAVAYVLTNGLALAIPIGLIVAILAFGTLRRA